MSELDIPQTSLPEVPYKDPGVSILHGRFGLRAVWGILLFVVLLIATSFCFNVAARLAQGKSAFPKKPAATKTTTPIPAAAMQDVKAGSTALSDGAAFLAVLFVCLILARVERRRIGVYGIGRNRFLDFLPGALWGLVTLSLLVFALRSAHVLVFDGRNLSGTPMLVSGAKWLLAFLTVGLVEEYLNRGYLQYTFTRGFYTLAERISPANARAIAFWAAAVLMSCVFGVGHLFNPGETAPGITAVFLAGMVFSYALWRTGSLWWAIGFHMAWDWAQSFLYGVPDSGYISAGRLFNTHAQGNPLLSGGTAGPEGSVLVIPTLLLVALIIRFTPAGAQPSLEPLPRISPVLHSESEAFSTPSA